MLNHALILILLLVPQALGPSARSTPGAAEERHYPTLVYAEVPLYPPLALTAHISGTVEIEITVENGTVILAQVKSSGFPGDAALTNPSLGNIQKWKFRPEPRTTFLVTFIYEIRGEQTDLPENPKVELDLPKLVRVTARPFKPTIT